MSKPIGVGDIVYYCGRKCRVLSIELVEFACSILTGCHFVCEIVSVDASCPPFSARALADCLDVES